MFQHIVYCFGNRQGLFAYVRTCKTRLDTTTKFMVVVTSLFNFGIIFIIPWQHVLSCMNMAVDLSWWFQQRCSSLLCYKIIQNLIMLHYCRFFFTLANSEKKITSADPSDLLSSNMVVQLSSCSISISFPNPCDATVYKAIQNSKSSSTMRFTLHFEVIIAGLAAVASLTRIWKVNSDWPRKQLHRHIGTQ